MNIEKGWELSWQKKKILTLILLSQYLTSGVPAAIGYAEKSNKKFELGLIRNHYVGRTFIEPTQNIRSLGVKLKLNPTKTFVKNKTIILIDDSLVRGTTCYKIVRMLYESGAKKCMSGLHAQK